MKTLTDLPLFAPVRDSDGWFIFAAQGTTYRQKYETDLSGCAIRYATKSEAQARADVRNTDLLDHAIADAADALAKFRKQRAAIK